MTQQFADRRAAGLALGRQLSSYCKDADGVVFGLARGGMPVAHEVARELGLPLDVLVVRKLGSLENRELAVGAIAPGGVCILNTKLIDEMKLTDRQLRKIEAEETEELRRRTALYRGTVPYPSLEDRMVILVDDGLATGATMQAAVRWADVNGAREIIVAAPVSSGETCKQLERENARTTCICTSIPHPFVAVGAWYRVFDQTNDEEVLALLAKSESRARDA